MLDGLFLLWRVLDTQSRKDKEVTEKKTWKEIREAAHAKFLTNPEHYAHRHGEITMYTYYGCRCDKCTAKANDNKRKSDNNRRAKKRVKPSIKPIEMAYADYPTPVAKVVEEGMDDELIRARLFNQIEVQFISETFLLALTDYMENGNPEVLPPVFKTMRKNIVEGRVA